MKYHRVALKHEWVKSWKPDNLREILFRSPSTRILPIKKFINYISLLTFGPDKSKCVEVIPWIDEICEKWELV